LLDENGSIAPGSIILVNGHNVIHLEVLSTKIDNDDVVTLFPPSAGG
jgi:molybdopterin synthase sulfur carrier subunit